MNLPLLRRPIVFTVYYAETSDRSNQKRFCLQIVRHILDPTDVSMPVTMNAKLIVTECGGNCCGPCGLESMACVSGGDGEDKGRGGRRRG